ncbi:lovastatin nonaketide synthase [Coccidioides immitis RMSCC 3703]|uniref:Lovastatin nonaketide synthase n=1 Tax=Coccidioides immitis RMSCC 3703 TaxID=454286 RepID=A0A0J8U369_COCIT|nr:lovastatin nonaketide synthase [Coccidioides immitis RMSCC 3703]
MSAYILYVQECNIEASGNCGIFKRFDRSSVFAKKAKIFLLQSFSNQVIMPFLRNRCSSGSDSSNDHYSSVTSVVSDYEYPASSIPGYGEKPLSEQLEPIAVVGMGCRLPGGVSSPAQFWELIMNKGTGRMAKVPKSRFNIDAHLHLNNERPGSFNVPGGYFLNDSLQELDPVLFGISPVKRCDDPQQRNYFEVVYETLESAGVAFKRHRGNHDSLLYPGSSAPPLAIINLKDRHMNTAKLGVLSPTSTCHTFNAHADGYGRADGVGAVYLKRLHDAVRDGDPIRAIIRSSAVNSNGKAPGVGITHPSSEGQEAVIRQAYRRGGDLDPMLTGYFETHGTGTPIGDPLEVGAVSKAMNSKRKPEDGPLLIGAVKTNIGHSEAASGLSAVIKAVLAVEKGIIPPTRSFTSPNPAIDWKGWNVKVVSEATLFPTHLLVKRVSVNSFGYGGTNGHVIIEGADSFLPTYQLSQQKSKPRGTFSRKRPYLLVFSAHNKPTLSQNIEAYGKVAEKYNLLDLSYTLGNRRSRLASRAYVVTSDATLVSDFKDIAKFVAYAENKKKPSIGFIFTGQGAQWVRMAGQLMTYYPSFLRTIKILDRVLNNLPDTPEWTIEDELLADAASSRVNEAEFSQPLCTAVQIALIDLLTSWGITPAVTVGHSSGEIAAAYAAGKISRMEAIILAFYRGQTVRDIDTDCAMLAVGLGPSVVKPYIAQCDDVTIACHNSPSSVTLSGDSCALEVVKEKLEKEGIFARTLKTGGKAYHSKHMEPASAKYIALVQNAKRTFPFDTPSGPTAVMVSSVTASTIPPNMGIDEHYWAANLVNPVLFSEAIEQMPSHSVDMLIEIGPHSALAGPVKQIRAERKLDKLAYLPTLVRGQDCAVQLLKLAGELFLRDYPLNMDRVTLIEQSLPGGKIDFRRGSILVDLPPYQWTYGSKILFAEPRQSVEHRDPTHGRHDVLGRKLLGGSKTEPTWRNILRVKDLPWLKDHSLGGDVIFPAAAYFSMAMEAVTQVNETSTAPTKIDGYTLRDISIKTALIVPEDDDGIETIFTMHPSIHGEGGSQNVWWDFNIYSISQGGIQKAHMTGMIGVNIRPRGEKPRDVPNMPQRASGKLWNQSLRAVGFDYGPTFQDMDQIRFDGKAYAASSNTLIKQECGIMQGESRHILHPVTVDSCLQLIIVSIYAGKAKDMTCGAVPLQVDEVTIWPPTPEQLQDPFATAYSWTDERGIRSFRSGAQLTASDGGLLIDIKDMRSIAYEAAAPQKALNAPDPQPYMEIVWKCDIDTLTPGTCYQDLSIINIVEMISHKNPGAKILDLEAHHEALFREQAPILNYNNGSLSDDTQERYDLILANGVKASALMMDSVSQRLVSGGRAVLRNVDTTVTNPNFSYIAFGENLVIAKVASPVDYSLATQQSHPFVFVYRHTPAPLVYLLADRFTKCGWKTRLSSLDGVDIEEGERVLVVAELEEPLLSSLGEAELVGIQRIISTASSLLWITQGGLLSGKEPEYAMASGLARSVKSENASLDFITIDLDLDTTSLPGAVHAITDIVRRQVEKDKDRETEYCVAKEKVYISRLLPNKELSSAYSVGKSHFEQSRYDRERAIVGRVQSGKVIFEQDKRYETRLEPDQLEVKVHLSGLAKGVAVIQGQDYPTAFSHEIFGTVTRVRSTVGAMRTTRIFRRRGCAAAAIRMSKLMKANTFVTVESEAEAQDVTATFGLPRERVITGFLGTNTQIDEIFGPRGIDVIFCSGQSSPGIVRECWRRIAPFGRAIACGRKNVLKRSVLDTVPLNHGGTYSSFDILDLYNHKPHILADALRTTIQLYREGSIPTVDVAIVKHLTQLDEAMAKFSEGLLQDRVLISYGETDRSLNVAPTQFAPQFDPKATYFLVGCLGGLGRSITSWMMENGARYFIFLSRSGTDSKNAALLVKDIEAKGAIVQVARGDVSSKKDVENAIRNVPSDHPIKGVVQAAARFQDAMFETMSHEKWINSISPKVIGTKNLHEALADFPLDFFLMTSSTSGTLGTPGQANYAAANSFLDALARHRVSKNKAACSLILPMVLGVGYVAEHPEIEEALKRKGIYGIDEEHMLQSFEAGIAAGENHRSTGHIVIGMDPAELQKSLRRADTTDAFWLGNARFKGLLQTIRSTGTEKQLSKQSVLSTIRDATSPAEAVDVAVGHFTDKLVRLLHLERDEIEPSAKSIASYGLDSMIGVELRNWIFKEFELDFPFQKLLAPSLTIMKFAAQVCESQGVVVE